MAETPTELLYYTRPYPHQVGGHGQLAVTTSGLLLKPLEDKEFKFYSYIHSDDLPPYLKWLRDVTPKFYGEVDHSQLPGLCSHPLSSSSQKSPLPSTLSKGRCSPSMPPPSSASGPLLTAHSLHPCSDSPLVLNTKHPFRFTALGCTDISQQSRIESFSVENDAIKEEYPVRDDVVACPSLKDPSAIMPQWRCAHGSLLNISPWAAKMSRRKCTASASNKNHSPSRWIMLEDVNSQFMIPCVMDCKIGTRHYDDDATPEKRQRHIDKANRTTSSRCGIRYTGMQSFKRDTRGGHAGMLLTVDKYHGRELKEHDLLPEATWFFHDGFDVRPNCVRMILDRLHELYCYLDTQNHFYFYSSSLLLVYEGSLSSATPDRVDVRMIDFAHTVLSNGQRDDGYLRGISYLIRILNQIVSNEQCNQRVLPTRALPQSPPSVSHAEHSLPSLELKSDSLKRNENL